MFLTPARDSKRNRGARERALVGAARKLFAARGFETTTTRDIAAQAGCAEGLIHRYFKSKAGLLQAVIQARISQEVSQLHEKLPLATSVEAEVLQLVDWELDRMWADREFLRVVIPRALLDAGLHDVLIKNGPLQRVRAITERLCKFAECRMIPRHELEALANHVSIMGFMFGFMRPVILGQDRDHCRKMAVSMTRLLLRGFYAGAASEELFVPPLASAL